jgi:hypothetical protein
MLIFGYIRDYVLLDQRTDFVLIFRLDVSAWSRSLTNWTRNLSPWNMYVLRQLWKCTLCQILKLKLRISRKHQARNTNKTSLYWSNSKMSYMYNIFLSLTSGLAITLGLCFVVMKGEACGLTAWCLVLAAPSLSRNSLPPPTIFQQPYPFYL